MFTTSSLAKAVREYLDVERCCDERRAGGGDVARDAARVGRARRALVDATTTTYPAEAEPLMAAVRAYLHAEAAVERCRPTRSEVDAEVRDLDRARRDLEVQLAAVPAEDTPSGGGGPATARPPKRFLVAVDGGEPAGWAVAVAGRLAQEVGGRVILVHVVKPVLGFTHDYVSAARQDAAHLRAGGEVLAAAQRELPAGVQAERVLREGEPADEVVEAARECAADLVVVGTRGRGRVAQFLLGSTAEAVIRRAPCPVLTVGHDSVAARGERPASAAEAQAAVAAYAVADPEPAATTTM